MEEEEVVVEREEVYIRRKLLFATSSDGQGRCEEGEVKMKEY